MLERSGSTQGNAGDARSVRVLLWATAIGAALFTLLVSVLPFVSFSYRSLEAHVAIETAAALVAGLAALLVTGRLRTQGRASDLWLVIALLLFAGNNLAFSTIAPLAGAPREEAFATWAPVAGRLIAAAVFAVAAFVPDRPLRDRARAVRVAALAAATILGCIALVVTALAGVLPSAIDPELSPESAGRPRIVGNSIVLAVQLVSMTFMFAAAVGFGRRALRTGEDLSAWLAAAAILGGFSRLNFFLFPSLYSSWVYTGDVLRLGFNLALLVGAAREIVRSQRDQAEVRLLEERRRMARDIHDGLAQELAFIVTHTQRLGSRTVGRRTDQQQLIDQVTDAAQRALDESRSAIEVLTTPLDEPVADAVARAAENVAERYGARVRTDLREGVEAPPEVRGALVRIVREAVTNAVRHGGADTVLVELGGPPLVLRIRDDGSGFEPPAANGGFGLTSMRERAEALGGSVTIESAPRAGTTVEVRLP